MSFLNFVFQGIATIVGIFISIFILGQMLIITNVGIPLATRLKNKELLPDYAPVIRYVVSFFLLFVLLAISIFLVNLYFQNFIVAFLLGLGIGFFFVNHPAKQLNQDNLTDFLQTNAKFFTKNIKDLDEDEFKEYFVLRNIPTMQGNEVFSTILGDALSNTLFFGGIVVIIFVVGKVSWWIGIILATLYALLILFSVLQNLLTMIANLFSWFIYIYYKIKGEELSFSNQFWLTAAGILQSLELVIDVLFVLFLYQTFFPAKL